MTTSILFRILMLCVMTTFGCPSWAQEYLIDRIPTQQEYVFFLNNSHFSSNPVDMQHIRVGGHGDVMLFRVEREDVCQEEFCLTVAVVKCSDKTCPNTSIFAGKRVLVPHVGMSPLIQSFTFSLHSVQKDRCGVILVIGIDFIAADGCLAVPMIEQNREEGDFHDGPKR